VGARWNVELGADYFSMTNKPIRCSAPSFLKGVLNLEDLGTDELGRYSGEMSMSRATVLCCLCGKPATDEDPITRDHVPPKQFYPKKLRDGLNLWVVPTHKSCNNQHKSDEEYFYHALYPLVANVNPRTAGVMFDDLKRRAKEPQTPKLVRSILKTARTTTEAGIILPPGMIRINTDKHRLQRVAIKIGRCLFYRDHKRVMPHENCKDIRLCEREEDVPELYTLSWAMSKVNVNDLVASEPGGLVVVGDQEAGQALTACRQVFDYRPAYFDEKRLHLYTLRFWEAFVFCMAFEDPHALPH
jgi:hypothetical protein